MALPQIAGIGGEYLLLGFFLFVAFYIIVRLLAEKHEHAGKKENDPKKLKGDFKNQNKKDH